jgi:enamine deaminase RidA (YjgF/YER057c/UK114 family)
MAAEVVTLNLLATLKAELGGLSRVARVVRVVVFVNSTPEFTEQHLVAYGATDLLVRVCGDLGRPARSAIGVTALPLNFAVEIEALVEVHD